MRVTRLQAVLVLLPLLAACADAGPTRQRAQITECPVGLMLVCESRSVQEPSRAGPDEDIPLYDTCRCVPDNL